MSYKMKDENVKTDQSEMNLADMSDDEIETFDTSKLKESNANATPPETEEKPSAPKAEAEDTAGDDTGGADIPDNSDADDDEDADSTSTDVSADAGTESQTKESQKATPDSHQESDPEVSVSKATDDSTSEVNYKDEFAKVMAPFKAAKREIKLDNIDDARRLMQMGVDYSRKMEAMKPYQRVLKTLEKNNLLDIGRLNFLIDLDKKNPEAIKKFLKDSEIDPMDLSFEDDTQPYKPTDHMVGEQEVALDDVLDEIRQTDTFDRTAQVITKEWDTASRRVLFESPSIIRTLNDHMQAGIFDHIAEVMARERVLGRLTGLSDLEAYKTVGDAIQAQGGFDQPNPAESSPNGGTAQQSQNSGSKSDKTDELRNRRLAASSPKGSASAGKPKVNLGDLTDDQIEKMSLSSL